MTPIQPIEQLESFYQQNDPWHYETHPDDQQRKNIILSEIPIKNYKNVLDIGCGHGFITRNLPGKNVLGVDVSLNAISQAKAYQNERIQFIQSSIFDLLKINPIQYDLILITGVLYPQYIGQAYKLIYLIIDRLLLDDGILLCCHIDQWYAARFPYLMLDSSYFPYRDYTQRLEVYVK